MWNYFKLWLQHKLDPHCQHCEDLLIEKSVCQTCEVLKLENARLLDLIDKLTTPINVEPKVEEDYSNLKPIRPTHIPWKVKQQELEQNDRAKARSTREAANAPQVRSDITSIEELETEVLGVNNGTSS